MNALDIIILILIVVPAIFGLKKGLIKSVFSYISIVTGIILSVKFNSGFVLILKPLIKDPKLAQVITFVLIILTIYLLGIFIASKISKLNFISETIDKIGGFLFGGLKGILFVSLSLLLLVSFSMIPKTQKSGSFLFPYVSQAAPSTYNLVKDIIPFNKKDFNDVLGFVTNDSTKTK
ncbi:MAG: CvpA family protein [Ignavibacteriota bacterium]|nr:CvpA family protein [Ignavibacteriota bacterium]